MATQNYRAHDDLSIVLGPDGADELIYTRRSTEGATYPDSDADGAGAVYCSARAVHAADVTIENGQDVPVRVSVERARKLTTDGEPHLPADADWGEIAIEPGEEKTFPLRGPYFWRVRVDGHRGEPSEGDLSVTYRRVGQ